jgi:acetylornithine deacetylase/succinyl-diaminopimelate desuccinylase-like protein
MSIRSTALAVALPGILCLSIPGGFSKQPATELRQKIRDYRLAHERDIVAEFVQLLSLPNHATNATDIERNARTIQERLEHRSVEVRMLRITGAPPVVYGELRTAGTRPTIGIYAHYDGQPVDAAQWRSPPFGPVLVAGGHQIAFGSVDRYDPESRIYARSASDDKAPIQAIMTALDALRSLKAPLAVNLKLLFEGEEEMNSPHLAEILSTYPPALDADVWLISDGPVHQSRRMQVFYGVRGEIDLEMTVYGAARPLHSGHYGNWAPNPIMLLTHLLDSMRDANSQILIPHFYDDVRPLTATEQGVLARTPGIDPELRHELAIAVPEGEGATLAQQVLKPAINVRGIHAGHVGTQAANIISTEATASFDFRLVPNQSPDHVRKEIEEHIARQGFFIAHDTPDLALRRAHARIAKLEWGPGYPAYRTSIDNPVTQATFRALEQAVGGPVVEVVSVGAAIPMYIFEGEHHTPVIGLPIANHDNNQHAYDENLRLQNMWDAIEMYGTLVATLGHDKSAWPQH